MKRSFFSYFLMAALMLIIGCKDDETKKVSVTGVTVQPSSLRLKESATASLTAKVEPSNATDPSVTWSSDKTDIADVDQDGNVTAKTKGTAVITVTTNDGGKTTTCTVTVSDNSIEVTGVELLPQTLLLAVGDPPAKLTATIQPSNATDKSVTWSSDMEDIAEVDDDGNVTAIAEGTAIITVTTNDGKKTATCTVTVSLIIPVSSVEISEEEIRLFVGDTKSLTATVLPANAADKSVTWGSTEPTIADVDEDGNVTGKSEGTATIYVTTNDGNEMAYCIVKVFPFYGDVTEMYLVNTTQPFIKGGHIRDNRWFRAAGWTAQAGTLFNPAHTVNDDSDGDTRVIGIDNDGSQCLVMYRQMDDARLFQTVTLPAGHYKFQGHIYSISGGVRLRIVAISGDIFPCTNCLGDDGTNGGNPVFPTLAFQQTVPKGTILPKPDGGALDVVDATRPLMTISFSLEQETVVSLGFSCNIESGNLVGLGSVRLIRTEFPE